MDIPKYSKLENERRYLVALPDELGLERMAFIQIEDIYIADSRLRLRAATDSISNVTTHKFCKKYLSDDRVSGPIVNIYVSAEEHAMLKQLPGAVLRKRRYHIEHEGHRFGVDVFQGDLTGLILCEIEMPTRDQVCALRFPPWAIREVTDDPFFTGGNLCRIDPSELHDKLSTL